jgi:hypothetical protein
LIVLLFSLWLYVIKQKYSYCWLEIDTANSASVLTGESQSLRMINEKSYLVDISSSCHPSHLVKSNSGVGLLAEYCLHLVWHSEIGFYCCDTKLHNKDNQHTPTYFKWLRYGKKRVYSSDVGCILCLLEYLHFFHWVENAGLSEPNITSVSYREW